MSKKRCEVKVRCRECKKVIFLTDGCPLSSKNKIECPHCGHQNQVKMKKNGKIRIY
jgi:DNA-directed RNA polymerase subunit RPC12/RpoP